MMKEMTGACLYCGQTRIVQADSQERADLIATKECGACDNPLKRTAKLNKNIESLCGELVREYGMMPLDEEVVENIKNIGALIIGGDIESASFRVADSTIGMKNTKSGVSVYRNKTISAKLEA